ncbi:MAG: helix-turn-helix transcriptional regulator [Streptococcus equinus]|nr:helix-turn-helix transcriptional regulator [Streptococcus equinus]MBE6162600.1 helix-turn-helix transcriptional regulator [Streptococcus equinus]
MNAVLERHDFERPYINLKSIIVSKGMKQKQIAERLDMNKSTFSAKINRHNGRDFSYSEACQIAHMLGIKMEDF